MSVGVCWYVVLYGAVVRGVVECQKKRCHVFDGSQERHL